MKSLRDWQNEIDVWEVKNFPNKEPWEPLLGVGEEAGELMHAHLKGKQGIRHTPLEIFKMKQDAVGDIFIFLNDYCTQNNIDFQDAVEKTWDEVSKRNWIDNKQTGKQLELPLDIKEVKNEDVVKEPFGDDVSYVIRGANICG